MKFYHKIETLYKRSTEGDRQLLIGDYRSDTIQMLADYPIWNFYEKIDGSNHVIEWDGHTMWLHGRTGKSNVPPHILSYYCDKFVNSEVEELLEQIFGESKVNMYFEATGPKVQTYGAKYSDTIQFILLDCFYEESNRFMSYAELKELAKALDVKVKPLLGCGSLHDAEALVKSIPMSTISEHELPMEGVVCVPVTELKNETGDRIIVKIRGCDHVNNFVDIIKHYK